MIKTIITNQSNKKSFLWIMAMLLCITIYVIAMITVAKTMPESVGMCLWYILPLAAVATMAVISVRMST